MEALDPGWAAIIGAGIGALATALGSAVGPIVRDSIARRASRDNQTRETRSRLAMLILEALDDVTGVRGDERRAKLNSLTKLLNEASLVDKRSELANMVELSTVHLSAEENLLRNLIAGYTQSIVIRWGRSESIPTLQEFSDETGRLIEALETVETRRVVPADEQ